MATKKATTDTEENIVEEVPTTENVTNQIDYKLENDKLKSEMEELKVLMQQVLQSTQESKTTTAQAQPMQDVFSGNIYGNSNANEISPTKRINVISLFDGRLNLKGENNIPIVFPTFGSTRPITYENIIHICTTQRDFAEQGYFIIQDKDVVDSLYLTNHYKKFINKEMIENIITLPTEKIKEIYDTITDQLREVVFDTIVNGVLSGDNKYSDRNKIHFISELYDKDIYATVELLREKK